MSVMTPEQFRAEVQRQQAITTSIGTAAPAKPTKYVSPWNRTTSISGGSSSGGGSPSAPAPAAPVKTAERLEEEYQPIESMTLTEAEAQGYEYSGAAGWHRPRPTIKNVEMLRARAMQQREELSHMQNVEQRSSPDPGRIYFIGDNQVSRAEYLNTLAVAQIKNSAYLGKLKTAGAQIHEAERLRRTTASQSNLNTSATKKISINVPTTSQNAIKNRRVDKLIIDVGGAKSGEIARTINELGDASAKGVSSPDVSYVGGIFTEQKRQEELSRIGQTSLKWSEWLSKQGKKVLREQKERGRDSWAGQRANTVIDLITQIPAGVVAVPAFVEGMVKHPKETSVLLGGLTLSGLVESGRKDAAGTAADLYLGGKVFGGLIPKHTPPKLKITGVKSVGHDVFSVASKTGKGKGTMYSYKAQYDVARQADSIMARMLGKKPKTEVVRVGTDVAGKFKQGKKFDLDASVRSGQENVVFAKISGKYSVKTLDKAGAKTPIKGVSREHGTLRHNTEMDIHHGKAGTSAVKIGAKGTKHTASTKITYSKFTRHQAAGKASIVDEATRAVFHSMDDSLSAGLARGRIHARIIDTGKVKVSRTEGMISRVHTGGSISGGRPVVRHAPKPAPTGQPMKPMDMHLPTTRPSHTLQAMTQRVKQGQQAIIHKAEVLRQASRLSINYAMRNRPAVNTANMGRISGRILSMDSIILSAQNPERRQDRIMQKPVPVAQSTGQLQERGRKNKVGRPQMLPAVPSMEFLVEQGREQGRMPRQGQLPMQGQQPYQQPLPKQTPPAPQIRLPPMEIPVIPQLTRSKRIRMPLVHSNRMQLGGMNNAVNIAQKSIHHQMMSAKRFLQSL